jgi:gliding motility-associated-like protein
MNKLLLHSKYKTFKSSLCKRILLVALGFIFVINTTHAQTDTEFWFAAPAVTAGHANSPIVFRFTSYDKPALITISQPANPAFIPIIISIKADSTITKDVTYLINNIESKPGGIALKTGIKITATANISAYYEVIGRNTNNNKVVNPEIFPLKGRSAKGLEFIIPGQTRFDNHAGDTPPAHNGFVIVATENDTEVVIVVSNPDAAGHNQNEKFTITLQKGESYAVNGINSYAGIPNLHLGGSSVSSNKPICITIYDDSILIGGNYDLVGDQIVPIINTGTEFIIVKGVLSFPSNANTDLYYIWPSEDATTITINGVTLPSKINKGKSYEGTIAASNEFAYITTDKPVYILHLTGIGQEATATSLPSIKCTGSSEVSFVRSTPEDFYLNIICKATEIDNFSLNGVANIIKGTMFKDVPSSSGWKAARISITNLATINNLILSNTRTSITNSSGLFHVGFLNGVAATGARLGYFSNYSKVTLAPNIISSSCLGGDIQLASTLLPNVIYSWTGPNGFTSNIANPIISNATINDAGYYYVEANLAGCGVSTDSISITINPLPLFKLTKSTDTVCFGDSKSIQFSLSGKAPWEVVYNDGVKDVTLKNINSTLFSFIVSPISKTIYSFISISDSNSCLANAASIDVKDTIIINQLPIANFNYSAIHCEKSATIFTDASVPDLDPIIQWYWNMGNGATHTLSTSAPINENYTNWGPYDVKLSVKSLLGCISDTITKTININSTPIVGFKTPSVCLDGGLALFKDTSSSPNLSTGFSYLWNFNAGPAPISPAPTYMPDELTKMEPSVLYNIEGTYQVSLQVRTGDGCVDSITKPFIINGSNPIAYYKVIKDTALCSNEFVIIQDSSWVYPGAVGKLRINWGDGETSIINDPSLNKQYSHLYTNAVYANNFNYGINVQAYSGGTCVDDSLFNISLVLPPSDFNIASPSTPYLCINDTLQLIPVVTGGTVPFTYEWVTNNTNAIFLNNTITGLKEGIVNVNVTVTDSKNCSYDYTNKLTLNIPVLPIASFVAMDTVICNGDAVTLNGSGSNIYKWYRNGILTNTNLYDTIHIGAAGNYTLIVNNGQCNSLPSNPLQIIDFDIPVFNLNYDPFTCLNGNLTINTDAIDKYKIHYAWNFGDGTSTLVSNALTHSYKTVGDYVISLKVTNDYCPRYDTTIVGDTVRVVAPLQPSIFTQFLLAEIDTMLSPLRTDTGYTQYQWTPTRYLNNPLIASPIFNGPGSIGSTTDYILIRTNPTTSCAVADVYKLDISSDVVVAIPKAFTPNGDNLNDVLKIELGAGLNSLVRFTIFNRWGKTVFSSQSINEGWDGKTNGIPQEMDAYTYFIEYISYKNERFKKTGSVVLLR